MPQATKQTSGKWLPEEALEYVVDASQRSILYWDIMRQRGNIYLDHRAQGQPPVLVFEYTTIVDGRRLERPVNYSLVQIIDKRGTRPDRRSLSPQTPGQGSERRGTMPDRRLQPRKLAGEAFRNHRPVLIIDPRAGHGPGIGGAKLDS
ncbi:MAG: DUF3141 domain-containing protein, partial [Deltaproteobacteria bacterium]|nr:DUF3141 domain-containing protein [Deltaproteobacteria bacterium]